MNRLPELLSNTINAFPLPVAIVLLLAGFVCLLAGSKFYWLATGLNAFMVTYISLVTLMIWPGWQHLLAAGIAAVVVALLTIAVRRISFSLNSFFIFGLLAAIFLMQFLSFENNSFTPIVLFFVAGSVAAFYNLMNAPQGIIYTTAFIGGFAIALGLFRLLGQVPNPLYIAIVWAVLGIAGGVWQMQQVSKEKQELDWG